MKARVYRGTLGRMRRAGFVLMAVLCGLAPLGIARQTPEEAQVRAACGPCHAVPPPDVLPKSAWRDEIVRMTYIRENRLPPVGRGAAQIQLPPDMQQALLYYTARAPERLAAPEPWPEVSGSIQEAQPDDGRDAGDARGIARAAGRSGR
jgi:hypothetical protein